MLKLHFSKGNAKLHKTIAIFSLPAGFTCPFAKLCRSFADEKTGKITDGQHCKFRCYAASAECLFYTVRRSRWQNYRLLLEQKTTEKMAQLILTWLPSKAKFVRVHSSGDFFSQNYFDAWLLVARQLPDVTFYAYTKAIPYWLKRQNVIPANFKLVASLGGHCDKLIARNNLRFVKVVYSEAEAKQYGLPIDHDDSLAYGSDGSFALMIHGVQPAKTFAAQSLAKLRKAGVTGYPSKYFDNQK